MSGDYLWDKRGPRDPDVERLERALGTFGQQDPPPALRALDPAPTRRVPAMVVVAAVAAAMAVCATAGFLVWQTRLSGPGLPVTRVEGAPTIGARSVDGRGELGVGGWLETDTRSRAAIDVADIGRVDVDPGSRVRLLRTRPGDYRLRLERGTLHALIWAPPGQFAVETRSSTAVDLGCSYSLTIDDEGVGLLQVVSGWVGFAWKGRESFIPAGAVCLTRPGLGPGIPYFEDAPPSLRAAIATLDIGGGPEATRRAALDEVLRTARERDVVTLWHLLSRVEGEQRDLVFDRLSTFVAPPDGVTRQAVRAGRRDALDQWWDTLGLGTASWWRTWRQQWTDTK